MHKPDSVLNNQQWLICHKNQPNHEMLIFFIMVAFATQHSATFFLVEALENPRFTLL